MRLCSSPAKRPCQSERAAVALLFHKHFKHFLLTRLPGVSDIVSPEITVLSEPWRRNTAALPTAAALMCHYGNLISKQSVAALHPHIYHPRTSGCATYA